MAVVGLMGTVAERLLTSFVFSAESKSLNLGRFGKRSGYLVCCCEILQPNWGPLVTSKESVILWGLKCL